MVQLCEHNVKRSQEPATNGPVGSRWLKSPELNLRDATLSAFVMRNIEEVVFAEVHMPEELAMYLVLREWANMDR